MRVLVAVLTAQVAQFRDLNNELGVSAYGFHSSAPELVNVVQTALHVPYRVRAHAGPWIGLLAPSSAQGLFGRPLGQGGDSDLSEGRSAVRRELPEYQAEWRHLRVLDGLSRHLERSEARHVPLGGGTGDWGAFLVCRRGR
jgi:hypothetical protein